MTNVARMQPAAMALRIHIHDIAAPQRQLMYFTCMAVQPVYMARQPQIAIAIWAVISSCPPSHCMRPNTNIIGAVDWDITPSTEPRHCLFIRSD